MILLGNVHFGGRIVNRDNARLKTTTTLSKKLSVLLASFYKYSELGFAINHKKGMKVVRRVERALKPNATRVSISRAIKTVEMFRNEIQEILGITDQIKEVLTAHLSDLEKNLVKLSAM